MTHQQLESRLRRRMRELAIELLGERALPFVVARDVERILVRGAPPPRRWRGRP